MNPASVAGGIADALTFNLFDFDKENKKAAGGFVEMAAGGALQFGSHPDMLGMVGGLYLKTIVGSFGAFGFIGNKVKSALGPDIQKIAGGLGVQVSTGGGGAGSGVSNSVQFQAPQSEKKKVENIKNLSYKENTYKAINDGLNKLLINGIKIFDPAKAAEIEKKRSGRAGQIPSGGGAGQIPGSKAVGSFSGNANSGSVQQKGVSIANNFKSELGLTKQSAAAIAGNFAHESSGFVPGIREGGPFGQNSSPWPKGTVGKGYGWAQWTNAAPGDRYDKFIQSYGGDYTKAPTNEDNWKFAIQEMRGPEPLGSTFPKMTDVDAATVWFRKNWERAGVHHDGPRIKYAKQFLAEMAKGGKIRPNDPEYKEKWSGDGRKTILKEYSAGGEAIIAGAKKIIGEGRGTADQCANTTRLALEMSKHPAAGKRTQKGDLDTPQGTAYNGAAFAASFGGSDMGTVIKNKAQIKMGDIILWKADQDLGGSVNKGAITHVGIAADDGLRNQYDHNTSRGWHYRPHWNASGGTSWLAGIRLGGEPGVAGPGAVGSFGEPTKKSVSGGKDDAKPEKPKTLEEMIEAFKTGLTSALTKISTNVPTDNPTKSAEELPGNPVTTSTVSTSKITQMGSVRDKAVTQLKTIRDKAQRDEDATILPIVTERLVIQKVKQTINTGGGTSAVYTSPSPLLSQ